MSVSFWGLLENGEYVAGDDEPDTGCLCAQLDPTWEMYLEGSDLESLARSADPNCPICKGTGVEPGYAASREVNFASSNARDVLYLMGLADAPMCHPLNEIVVSCCDDDQQVPLAGELPVPEMRRQIMLARATFDRKVGALVREEEQIYGKPYEDEDGVIQIRPLRCVVPEKTADRIQERLEDLASFVEDVASQEATVIRWG